MILKSANHNQSLFVSAWIIQVIKWTSKSKYQTLRDEDGSLKWKLSTSISKAFHYLGDQYQEWNQLKPKVENA